MMAREAADPALSAELDRLSRGDAEFVSEATALQAVARPDLSHGAFPDLAMMRFWEITTFRVKPGHAEDFAAAAKAWASASARSAPSANWRTYEVVAGAPGGTFLVFGSVASFADFDKGDGGRRGDLEGADVRGAHRPAEVLGRRRPEHGDEPLPPRPGQSYVPMEARQKDPAFWMPKAAAKAPAKKP